MAARKPMATRFKAATVHSRGFVVRTSSAVDTKQQQPAIEGKFADAYYKPVIIG